MLNEHTLQRHSPEAPEQHLGTCNDEQLCCSNTRAPLPLPELSTELMTISGAVSLSADGRIQLPETQELRTGTGLVP